MKFGANLIPADLEQLRRAAALAEEVGFDYLGIADSQSLYRELYVSLTVAALATSRVRLGPTVTNVLTRHPAVAASAVSTLNELSGGRAFLGVGSGDSAVLNLGLRPAKLTQLREYLTVVRAFLSGESATYQGSEGHVRWSKGDVPILMVAEGPKTLRLAGELADIALLHAGLTPQVLRESIERVCDGERAAGKRAGAVEIWAFAKCNVADTREEALEDIKMGLAASGHHAYRSTLEGKHVPEELREAVMTLQREYLTTEHKKIGPTRNATLSDELGLTDFLAERFGVVGTPEECVEKSRAIQAEGVDVLLITAIGPRPEEIIRRFGREVIPKI